MNGGSGGEEGASATAGPSSPLEWRFSQVFGERTAGEEVQEVDIISAIEFDKTGDHLATGDRGGRVVLFERTDMKEHPGSRRELEKMDNSVNRHPEFRYKTEFQSHEPEFDYLKSLEIEEKINKIRWCQNANGALFLLSTNDKTIKFWKVQEKKVKKISDMNINPSKAVGSGGITSSSSSSKQSVANLVCLDRSYHSLGNDLSFPPGGIPSLRLPVVTSSDTSLLARCRRVYAHAHDYHINSISNNSDGETFISADDLRINLWNLEISNQSFNIVDVKPANMEDLTEVITSAEFHPNHCNTLAYSSSKGSIRLIDLRQSALCDSHSKLFEEHEAPGPRSFFTEIIASISDVKFARDGRYLLSRDYMTLKDSPVFNFLNNLSPIKPVKSIPMSQTISSLNFAAVPSVFTSPHVRYSIVLRRHRLPDPSKPEFASDCGNTVEASQANIDRAKQLDAEEENFESKASDTELAGEPSFDCSQFVVDYSDDPSYEGSTPNSSSVLKAKNMPDYACNTSDLVPIVPDSAERISYGSEVDLKGGRQTNRNEESPSCEWGSLMSDTFIFESPNDRDPYEKSDNNGESFYARIHSDMDSVQSLCAMSSGEQCREGNRQDQLYTQPGEENEIAGNAETCEIVAGSSIDHGIEEMDYELSSLYRGMRRRCLVFEMGGSRRKQCEENLDASSSGVLQSDCDAFLNDQSAIPTNTANNSSRCVLPGIGLHLNTLAATPKDYRIIGNDSSASGRLVIGPSSSADFHPSTSNQELLNNTLPVGPDEGIENAALPLEDPTQEMGYTGNEDISPNSPKKKRRKADQAGDAEGCKRCNCKKSKCLKLYCECFAAGVYCVEFCSCIDCFNKPVHEDTVLATRKQIETRNPLAFAPKVIRGSDPPSETGDDSSKTPASARHKRGCNCKKSGCLKKYCECYQGSLMGVKNDNLDEQLVILYASQTGNAMDAAERIGREAERRGCPSVSVISTDEFEPSTLPSLAVIIFVVSTTGQGENPDSMKGFWKFLLQKSLATNWLEGVNYAVFGLGDSSYQKYNFVAKKLDKRLLDLGATAVIERGLGDDQHPSGYEGALDPWMSGLWNALYQINHRLLPSGPLVASDASLVYQPKIQVIYHGVEDGMPPLSTTTDLKYLEAQIEVARSMIPKRTWKRRPDCFLNMEIQYEVGDVLEVLPRQNSRKVDAFIQRCNLDPESYITVYYRDEKNQVASEPSAPPMKLKSFIELTMDVSSASPKRYFFEVMSFFAAEQHEKERLQYFASSEGRDDLYQYNQKERRTVLEVMEDFPSVKIPFEWLVELVPPLKVRPFSIASSYSAHPNQVHITVSVVSWTTPYKRKRFGLCSKWLASIDPQERVYIPAWFSKGSLPSPRPSLPLILIGPGTGCAPFRGFVEERAIQNKTISTAPILFFFGCRNEDYDFLYRDFWLAHSQKGGVLSDGKGGGFFVAFSRDQQQKIYVQHKMREQSTKIWSLLSRGAAVYVAGSANKMPSDILSAFEDIISLESGVSREVASRWIRALDRASKYHVEAWS